MKTDKEYAVLLRGQGMSYRAIEKETGISRSTLSSWFKGLPVPGARENVPRETIQRTNMQQRLARQYEQALAVKRAGELFAKHEHETLFWAGLMLYSCNGDVSSKYTIRLTSADPMKQQCFIRFLAMYLDVPPERLSFHVTCYANTDIEASLAYWQGVTAIPSANYIKPTVLARSTGRIPLQNGVGASILTSAITKVILMRWLHLITEAVMV